MDVKSLRGTLMRLGLALGVALVAGTAGAAPTISLDIRTNIVGGYDQYTLTDANTAPISGGTFGLSGVGYGTNFNCDWSIVVNPDPSISGTFNLTNLSALQQTFTLTVTLPIAAIGAPTRMGGYFGDLTYTDLNGDSNVTLANAGSDSFYRALIDGNPTPGNPIVPIGDLGVFTANAFGGPGVFGTVSREEFGTPIPSAVGPAANSSIGIRVKFTLTGGDSVQVPVFFQLERGVPEPSAVLLIGLGLAGLVAARKRA